jgi:phage terminase Nu1 subunit (DNA packaging protein)
MRWVNKTDLAELTGASWKTVKKRLDEAGLKPDGDGNYRSDEALRAVVAPEDGGGEALDLTVERARLASEQADRVAMINAERRRDVVPLVWMSTVVANKGRQIASILDAIVPNMRRVNSALTAEDLLLVDREITKARNLAAQLNLDDADLAELARDTGGAEDGAAISGEIDTAKA